MFKTSLYYLFFLIVVAAGINNVINKQPLFIPSGEFAVLESLGNDKYDSITLGLDPFRGVMLATNFLKNVNVYSIEDSYFPKVVFSPERITPRNPLLTTENSCLRGMAIEAKKLSANLVLVTKVRRPDKTIYEFNRRPYCNGMRLQPLLGFSGIEEWGAWSDGERTELAVQTTEAYPKGGKLIIEVRPVINGNISDDHRDVIVEVDGKDRKSLKFSTHNQSSIEVDFNKKDAGSIISVVLEHVNPIRFSDISGSDPRRVSLGFISAKLISNSSDGEMKIVSVTGAYDRENDGSNWWNWVQHKVAFQLRPIFVPKEALQSVLRFEYSTLGAQTLSIRISSHDGASRKFQIQSNGDALEIFEKTIDLPPSGLREISIETDGQARRLSDRDARMAAWIIRNVVITPKSLEVQ